MTDEKLETVAIEGNIGIYPANSIVAKQVNRDEQIDSKKLIRRSDAEKYYSQQIREIFEEEEPIMISPWCKSCDGRIILPGTISDYPKKCPECGGEVTNKSLILKEDLKQKLRKVIS